MAARLSDEEHVQRLRELTAQEPHGAETRKQLRAALGSASAYRVALAARLIAQHTVPGCTDALVAALERLLEPPARRDPSCHAKLALLEALRAVGEGGRDVVPALRRALVHVQLEPVYGGQVDTAPNLRGLAAVMLAESGVPDLVNDLVTLLNDPEAVARVHAVEALAGCGELGVEAVLRLKARVGDAEPAVTSACFEALIGLWPERSHGFLVEALERAESAPLAAEQAALALGQARRVAALPALSALADSTSHPELRSVAMVAMGLLRHPDATEHLLDRLATGLELDALAALDGLAVQAHDDALRRRVERLVAARNSRRLTERFAERFPA